MHVKRHCLGERFVAMAIHVSMRRETIYALLDTRGRDRRERRSGRLMDRRCPKGASLRQH